MTCVVCTIFSVTLSTVILAIYPCCTRFHCIVTYVCMLCYWFCTHVGFDFPLPTVVTVATMFHLNTDIHYWYLPDHELLVCTSIVWWWKLCLAVVYVEARFSQIQSYAYSHFGCNHGNCNFGKLPLTQPIYLKTQQEQTLSIRLDNCVQHNLHKFNVPTLQRATKAQVNFNLTHVFTTLATDFFVRYSQAAHMSIYFTCEGTRLIQILLNLFMSKFST